MRKSTLEKYNAISQELNDKITSQVLAEVTDCQEIADRLDDEIFCLRYQKVLTGLRSVSWSGQVRKKTFQQDFEVYELLFAKKFIQSQMDDDHTLTYAVDFLTLTGICTPQEVLKQLSRTSAGRYCPGLAFGDCIAYAAQTVAIQYLEDGDQVSGLELLQALLRYSESRCPTPTYHSSVVTYILTDLEPYPQTGLALCAQAEPFYAAHRQVEQVDNYLWFKQNFQLLVGDRDGGMDTLSACIDLRRTLYGEDDWFTAFPIARYNYLTLCNSIYNTHTPDASALHQVEQFIQNTSANTYGNWDDREVRKIVGTYLDTILRFVYLPNDTLPQHCDFVYLFKTLCEEFDDDTSVPLLQLSTAKHVEGAYLNQTGDLIGSEQLFTETADPEQNDDTDGIISPIKHKLNLLHTYLMEYDLEKVIPLLDELLQSVDPDDPAQENDYYHILDVLFWVWQTTGLYTEEDIQDLTDELHEIYDQICETKDSEAICMSENWTVYILDAIQFLVSNLPQNNSKKLLLECDTILQYIEASPGDFFHRLALYPVLYLSIALVRWHLNDPAATTYARQALEAAQENTVSQLLRIRVFHTAIVIVFGFGPTEEVSHYIDQLLVWITDYWHSAIRYGNDERLENYLIPAQQSYSSIHGILCKTCTTEELYGYVLQFKTLASLAVRERNKFLHDHPNNHALLDKIKHLRDEITLTQTDAAIRESNVQYEKQEQRLRTLEAELAATIPNEIDFTTISFQEVAKAIPAHSTVLEYYVYASIADATIPADGEKDCPTYIDAFLLSKDLEDTHLQKITITDGIWILQMAEKVADIFLRESLPHGDPNAVTTDELTLRDRYLYELYALLIQPFQTELDRTATLYIAPDQALCLIPFEILRTSPTGTVILSDTHTITRLDSARDFLFASDSPIGTRRLVIGNPEYDATSREEPSLERSMTIQADSVQPLPFSEFEALRVSQLCQGECMIGSRATKSLLTSASNCGIIHIATHGFFDTSLEYDAAYASFLLFAGAKAWMQSGQLDPVYGNGIVTADEISRLDLRSTELVVLSACCSGMTDANVTRNLRGLTGGFAAAGVKYIVTQLWHSNDVATSILMGYFYEEYVDRHLLPPEALQKAKERLKKTTVSDMNTMGIIQYGIANSKPGTPMRALFDRLKSRPATARPYANEFYWGGFSCYQCR